METPSKEINVKSTTIEKGLELAKEFLGKLISPMVEEVGLLISDNIKYVRFKNQIRILLKARDYVEKHNISTKEIPVKILVPLLENASLEDDDNLQDKWAKMLVNMVDSENNLQNQIFPYLLSQISISEYEVLKRLQLKELDYIERKKRLTTLKTHNPFIEKLDAEGKKLLSEVAKTEQEGFILEIEQYEIANLLRLGLIRDLPPKIYIDEFKTGGMDYDMREQWHQIEAVYDTDDYGHRITELGIKFLTMCELTIKEAGR